MQIILCILSWILLKRIKLKFKSWPKSWESTNLCRNCSLFLKLFSLYESRFLLSHPPVFTQRQYMLGWFCILCCMKFFSKKHLWMFQTFGICSGLMWKSVWAVTCSREEYWLPFLSTRSAWELNIITRSVDVFILSILAVYGETIFCVQFVITSPRTILLFLCVFDRF